jgi:flagellar biosynthesis protein FlhG
MVDQATHLRNLTSARTQQKLKARGRRPYHITVTSGKGGVGKSTIALNLAYAIAETGKKVLLVDADANLGNLDVMVGVAPTYRLSSVLRHEQDIQDVLIKLHPFLMLLPGDSGEPNYPLVRPGVQQQLIEDLYLLEEPFEYLIIDTAAGLTGEVIGYAVPSDETLVVTSWEPTAIMDAYAMIKILTVNGYTKTVSVVVNGSHKPADADAAAQKLDLAVRHFLQRGIHYYGAIPFDSNVSQAICDQKIAMEVYPTSALSLSLQEILRRLIMRREHNSIRSSVL